MQDRKELDMVYRVQYRLYSADTVHSIDVVAKSKADAYDKAVYDHLYKQGLYPYSAWVYSVTYQNGNYKRFNTHEGKPY